MPEIKNPSQQPGTEKRLLLVFALTFVAVIISQQLLERFGPKTPAQPAKLSQSTSAAATSSPATAQSLPASTASPSRQAPASGARTAANAVGRPAQAISVKQASAESETVIENDLYRITFTNRGARVKSWILKKHTDDAGHPLNLVLEAAASQHGYPLSLFAYDEALRNKLNSALYVPSVTGLQNAPATVAFDYSDADGAVVHKSFGFDHTYVVKIESSVTQNGAAVEAYAAWPAGFGDQVSPSSFASSKIDWIAGDKVVRKPAKEGSMFTSKKWVSNGDTITAPFNWVGVSDQYFAAVFLPDQPADAALVTFHNSIPNPKESDPEKRAKDLVSVLGAAVGDRNGATAGRLFVGPKNVELLQTIRSHAAGESAQAKPAGPNLESVVDFGFFGFIAKPLFIWLEWTHDHWAPNWGWAIVILTLIINLALFPLRYTGMKSALLQQKIAPEIESIKSKYKGIKLTDPRQREMQLEIQQLQKREGINPLGGCLPTVIQMPFLFAFYSMLSSANELRNAHWFWVKDLSSPDPYHLLPIGIVISMFVMQRITPMAGMDAAQAKMMQTMMPLMIGLISWSLPAGLCVYWVAGNMIGWGQQYIMNNTPHAREVRAHLAKRAAKRR